MAPTDQRRPMPRKYSEGDSWPFRGGAARGCYAFRIQDRRTFDAVNGRTATVYAGLDGGKVRIIGKSALIANIIDFL